MPDSLLDEVTALVEYPAIYTCHFDPEFLNVPQECLILTMQTNQKYFALTDGTGKLKNRFLIVSNIVTDRPEGIISGNERVIRPRLSDARFFFQQDQKRSLESRIPDLAKVVYHNQLGNQLQRMERVRALAGEIAKQVDETGIAIDPKIVGRAAEVAKTDLLSDMVGEFPELQGVMGQYYALADLEHPDVAAACYEHYLPRFAGDALPQTMVGTTLAIADKLETIVGIWGVGLVPTGDKDPDLPKRLQAIRGFTQLSEAAQLAAANKRISNILKKIEGQSAQNVQVQLLRLPAEANLYKALETLSPKLDQQFKNQEFMTLLQSLAVLSQPIDQFFADVMVMDDDLQLRQNRIALLSQLHQKMNLVADIGKLA